LWGELTSRLGSDACFCSVTCLPPNLEVNAGVNRDRAGRALAGAAGARCSGNAARDASERGGVDIHVWVAPLRVVQDVNRAPTRCCTPPDWAGVMVVPPRRPTTKGVMKKQWKPSGFCLGSV